MDAYWGSIVRAGTYTDYDPATGLVAYTVVLNAAGDDADTTGRTTTSYDRCGRTVIEVGDAGTVTTGYDAADRVETVTDAKGTTTYGYDGAGERRGLVTHQISYVPGTPVQDQPWIAWTLTNDGAGRVRFEQSGNGAAYDDNRDDVVSIDDVADWTAAGQATSYQREYQYDYAGRLSFAHDAVAASAGGAPTVSCTTRTYAFDKNGRRTSLAATTRQVADCDATGTTVTTTAGGYDTAGRRGQRHR